MSKAPESCLMHSSVLYEGKILVYGGLCIDDNIELPQNKLIISNQFRVYDLYENQWVEKFDLNLNESNRLFVKLNKRQRYAHASFVKNSSFYTFAGFNGFFLNDLFKIDLNRLKLNEKKFNKS